MNETLMEQGQKALTKVVELRKEKAKMVVDLLRLELDLKAAEEELERLTNLALNHLTGESLAKDLEKVAENLRKRN